MVLKQLKQKIFGVKLAPAEIRDYLASEKFRPVFFLSTGRCGTRWFTELLQTEKKLDVHHNTHPELYEQSLLAYKLFKTGKFSDPDVRSLLSEVIFSARQELMTETASHNHRFVETNNRITFFTSTLAELFPHARFVHLYRDPAGFVKSGMNRNWYNDSRYDYARPFPTLEPDQSHWKDWSRVEKISWLWRETNQMIDRQLNELPSDRYRRFNFSDLSTDSVRELLHWLEIDIDSNTISAQLDKKVNAQKSGDFPSYPEWPNRDREDFLSQCGDYATYLGFDYKP